MSSEEENVLGEEQEDDDATNDIEQELEEAETEHLENADENVTPPEDEGQEVLKEDQEDGDEFSDLPELEDLQQTEASLSKEELEAEEAEFRGKYAFDLGEEEDDDEEGQGEDDENEQLEYEEEPEPTPDQMNAIIKFLEEEQDEDEEDGESVQEVTPPPTVPSTKGAGDEPNVMVLGPDHPKMARFQAALNAHLSRQLAASELELRNMGNELKMVQKERTDLGNNLYSLQHELLRQSETMEKYENDMEKLREKREKTEEKSKELRNQLVALRGEAAEEEEKELNLRESIKTLDYTEHVVRQAAEKYDGELKIRQLVREKLEKLRIRAEAEKRDQDFYLDKVLTHVQHMELINAGITRQIVAHQEEQGQLTGYINEAVTEIEALQIEKQHLQRAWNETISVVRARDDALNAARETLENLKEQYRIKQSELRAIAKLISKEQEGSERSLILLKRRKMEERVLKRQLSKLEGENEGLKDKLASLSTLRSTVEGELARANAALVRKEKEASAPRRMIETLALEKIKLEDRILAVIQEQSGLNKAAAHIQSLIKEARKKTREMETELARVENENGLLAVDVEKLKAALFKKSSQLSALDQRVASQEALLAEQQRDIRQCERLIHKKSSEVEKLNRKLEKLINQHGGVEMGPLEAEVRDLEQNIAAEKQTLDSLQNSWLTRQDDLVRLSGLRDSLFHQNELLRKEMFIMERKRQRLDSEVEKKRSEIAKVAKQTENFRSEIASVNAKLHKDRSSHESLDKDNILIQNELLALLKDAEVEAAQLEGDIEALEFEKESLISSLAELHEQNLQWEKKVKLAKELKDNLKKDQEGSSSSHSLKLSIHHMQVRYNEILRAQEKLMADLERSIERRDRIIVQADRDSNRNTAKQTKIHIQRNLSSLKERNKLLIREANEIEGQVKEATESIRSLEDKFASASNELNKIRESIHSCDEQISEAAVLKHRNLVEIVLRQEKFRILESIKHGRYRPSAKNVEELQKALGEAEKDCLAIVGLSDEIEEQYPEAAIHLKLVKASILPNVQQLQSHSQETGSNE